MKKLIELRRKKSELAAQLRTILEKADAENRSLNTEERTQFDDLKKQAEEQRQLPLVTSSAVITSLTMKRVYVPARTISPSRDFIRSIPPNIWAVVWWISAPLNCSKWRRVPPAKKIPEGYGPFFVCTKW